MPNRGKRNFNDFDPNKSDSDDSTYDQSAARTTRSKPSKINPRKPPRKRQRRSYDGNESDEMSEPDESSDESPAEVIEEEVEVDERTGRPKRKSTKKAVKYDESDEDSAGSFEAPDSAPEREGDEEEAPRKGTVMKGKKPNSLLLKLRVGTPKSTPGPTTRNTRNRSASHGAKRRPTPETQVVGTRRSGRIAHDDQETMVALTGSGHHAEIVRPGTRSPEGIPARAFKGGKGLKSLPQSAIVEEEEESSVPTKDEHAENTPLDPSATDVREIAASQHDDVGEDAEVSFGPLSLQQKSDTQNATQGDTQLNNDLDTGEEIIVPESDGEVAPDDEEDEEPVSQRRSTRHGGSSRRGSRAEEAGVGASGRSTRRTARSSRDQQAKRSSQQSKKAGQEESSDFEPGVEEGGEDEMSSSGASESSPRKGSLRADEDNSSNGRRSGRIAKGKSKTVQGPTSDEHDSEVAEELAEELEDLRRDRPRRAPKAAIIYDDKPKRRSRKSVDYRILRPDLTLPIEDPEPPSNTTPSRKGRGGGGSAWQRSLFSTYGPFGGAGGPPPVFGGPGGIGAAGGVDSDSSEDEIMQRPRGVGGAVGMTPTTATPAGFGLFPPAQAHNADAVQGPSGTPANLGRIKDKQALADADPLGVDQNVNFDSVGGLQGHIDQLKEMVALPLLYPEIFQRFHVTPPRGVLFHGPPGTGKTLLARALASSVSSQGRKVTFYMRKGADALSKWVGEAERQLRLLFDEARKNQPSIIFFDEIDGLAPVRSSKQEQIHASIVSTLLALMDGMDGRGQVIVIGATNRPDSVDPALRRPGRFDREFYFPLPNTEARRSILDIHTKGWEPPLPNGFKDELAQLTKGYGGADLRALCTEAALNAVQRRYPQIYRSDKKLVIDPSKINITAKDFMISIKKMVPSSERSASSGATPLPTHLEPLLRHPLGEIKNVISEILPQKRKLSALEEAQFEEPDDDKGFAKERMQQEFEKSRIFRPRLLIRGVPGMGQQYLAGAILSHFEGVHVQSFDLPTLLSDSTRAPEAAVVQLFAEVRRHKPSVIYIPNVGSWYNTVGSTVISTFTGLLRSLPPTEPILLLGVLESEPEHVNKNMIRDLFSFSTKTQFELTLPRDEWRREFFAPALEYLGLTPPEFPDPVNRKKRHLEHLKEAPPEPAKEPEPPSKEELKAQKKKDRQTLNLLKLRIQPIMDQIRQKFKKFRTGVIDESQIRYLYDEDDPTTLSTDLPHELRQQAHFRPFEKGTDDHGSPGLVEVASGKFYYNLEIVTIEKRLSNGYYKRPKDFLADIKKLTKDAKMIDDQERLLKANELQANVEVDMGFIETTEPGLAAECEHVYLREAKREKEKMEKARQAAEAEGRVPPPIISNVPPQDSGTTVSTGPIVLGQPLVNGHPSQGLVHRLTPSRPSEHSTLTNGYAGEISDLADTGGHGPQSNGSSMPSRNDADPHMINSDDGPSTERGTQQSSFGQSAQYRPAHSYTGPPSLQQRERSAFGTLSQRGAITPMISGSQPQDYANDASTTTSDKRTSDRSSAAYFNTQSTNGPPGHHPAGPELDLLGDRASANSQLPDTQGMNSQLSATNGNGLTRRAEVPYSQSSGFSSSQSQPQSQSQPGSQPPVPPFHAPSRPQNASIHALLNDETPPTLIMDGSVLTGLLPQMVDETRRCSVEQLEQINSRLMDYIWRTRGDWNRTKVITTAIEVFREALAEVQRTAQELVPLSLE